MLNNIEIVYEDADLLVQADRSSISSADTILTSFTGIGHGMGGIDIQRIEFAGTARRCGLIFVTDKNRSWGNNLDPDNLAELLRPMLGEKSVVTIGNSMGGFLALVFASIIGARVAIAFAPQFSVDPAIVPDEPRWMEYRKNVKTFRYPSLAGQLDRAVRYYTINGDTPLEKVHWTRFPTKENIHHFVVSGVGHDVALQLKKAGVLNRLIDDAIDERLTFQSFSDIPVKELRPKSLYTLAKHRLQPMLGWPKGA